MRWWTSRPWSCSGGGPGAPCRRRVRYRSEAADLVAVVDLDAHIRFRDAIGVDDEDVLMLLAASAGTVVRDTVAHCAADDEDVRACGVWPRAADDSGVWVIIAAEEDDARNR